jgi:hypothetical protein
MELSSSSNGEKKMDKRFIQTYSPFGRSLKSGQRKNPNDV